MLRERLVYAGCTLFWALRLLCKATRVPHQNPRSSQKPIPREINPMRLRLPKTRFLVKIMNFDAILVVYQLFSS